MTRFQAHRVRYTVRPRSMVADRRAPGFFDELTLTDWIAAFLGALGFLAWIVILCAFVFVMDGALNG